MSTIKPIVVAVRDKAASAGVKVPQQKLNDAIAIVLYGRPYAAVIAAENAGRPPQLQVEGVDARIAEVAVKYRIAPEALGQLVAPALSIQEAANGTARPRLEGLGFLAAQIENFRRIILEKAGIVFIAGNAGSGKSRTLGGLIERIIVERGNQYRIAEVTGRTEHETAGAIRVPVDHGGDDEAMAAALRKADALGVDAIMIDESRGISTLKAAIDAAARGRMVYVTVNASDAWNLAVMVGRMDLVKGFAYQNLVKMVCPDCAAPFFDGPASKPLDLMVRITSLFRRIGHLREHVSGADCKTCFGLGIRGRTVVAEVVHLSPAIRQALEEEGRTVARRLWMRDETALTIQTHAVTLIHQGLVDPRHAEAAAGPLNNGSDFVPATSVADRGAEARGAADHPAGAMP